MTRISARQRVQDRWPAALWRNAVESTFGQAARIFCLRSVTSILGLDEEGLSRHALNDLRNQAAAHGADYVYRSEPTFQAPYGRVTHAEYAGYAYRCAPR